MTNELTRRRALTAGAFGLALFALPACNQDNGSSPAPLEDDAASELVDDPTEPNRDVPPASGTAADSTSSD